MIDEKKLIEEIEILRVPVNGFRGGKILLSEFAVCYKELILRIIEEQPKVGGWIPVSERLPENDEYVLASDDCHRVIMAYHNERHGWCSERYGCCYVVAWMPLPEAYEGQKND